MVLKIYILKLKLENKAEVESFLNYVYDNRYSLV